MSKVVFERDPILTLDRIRRSPLWFKILFPFFVLYLVATLTGAMDQAQASLLAYRPAQLTFGLYLAGLYVVTARQDFKNIQAWRERRRDWRPTDGEIVRWVKKHRMIRRWLPPTNSKIWVSYHVGDTAVASFFRPSEASGDRWNSPVQLQVNPRKLDDISPANPYPGSSKVAFYVDVFQRLLWYPLGPILAFVFLAGSV